MKIGLALSGGGFRATVFHLGVLARLAESGVLEDTSFLSTVSGGSLCTGMIFSLNNLGWPTSEEYQQRVLPEARKLLTTQNLQTSLMIRSALSPWGILGTRADDLSAIMQKRWGVTAKLSDLPESPRWFINATCYETGKNWRFERFRMGDYLFGYSYDTQDVPVSDAMAASAGFPGLIGPLVFDPKGKKWFKYREAPDPLAPPEALDGRKTEPVEPEFAPVHLWDGGAYDNHGLEGLHDFITGWHKNVEFFVISDGAGRSKPEKYRRGVPALARLATGIMMDQVRSLRARAVIERMVNHHDPGVFLQTGNTCAHVLAEAGKREDISRFAPACMNEPEADQVANMPTVIRRLEETEFQRLFRHGFEVTDYTLYAYHGDKFPYVGFGNTRYAG
jgi:NTE family protein